MQASVQNRLRPQLSKENSGLNAAKGQVSGAAAPRNVLANITNIKSAQTSKENLKQQAQQGKLENKKPSQKKAQQNENAPAPSDSKVRTRGAAKAKTKDEFFPGMEAAYYDERKIGYSNPLVESMDFKALMKLVPEATELPLDFDAIPDGFAIHTDNVTALLLDDDMTPMSDDLALDRVAFDFGFDPLRLDDPAAF